MSKKRREAVPEGGFPRGIALTDRRDLELLLACALLIPAVWLVALGWSASQSAANHDQVVSTLPMVHDLLKNAQGDWTRLSYRLDILGGVKIHDVIGTMPIFQFLGWLGCSTVNTLNLLLFFTQAVCAFFGARIAYDLAELWSGGPVARHRLTQLGIILLAGFSPTVAWRITAGHPPVLLGAMVWVSLFALFAAERNRTLSYPLVGMAVLTQIQAFPTTGQQLVYGPVFTGVLLLAMAYPLRPLRKLLVPALVLTGSIAVSLPKLAGMIHHALSSDAGRSLGGASVIFSYVTATARDWISSIPWSKDLISNGREQIFFHEVNLGFGPSLLLLAAIPWKRWRFLGIGLAVSFFLAILFSMDTPGLTAILTALVPPLKSFRVPERAIIPFALILPAFASAALLLNLEKPRAPGWPTALAALAAGVLVFLAPAALREFLVWTLAGIVVADVFGGWTFRSRIPAAAALIVLGLGSAAAFKERLLPFVPSQAVIDLPQDIGRQLVQAQPELSSPLERLMLGFFLNELQTNSGYMMGVSSLNGYMNPPRRFLSLEAALSGHEENFLMNYFTFNQNSQSFPTLRQLYNVRFGVTAENNNVKLFALGPTAGRAWFSNGLTRLGTMPELAAALKGAGNDLNAQARARTWVVSADPVIRTTPLPDQYSADCAQSAVLGAEAPRGGQSVRVAVKTAALCPLTVAMNFTLNLHARAGNTPLTTFPSYGALLGVLVPPGATEILIEAKPFVPAWSVFAWFVGLGLLGGAAWEVRRTRQPPAAGEAAPAKT